jgi:hypothetical protein
LHGLNLRNRGNPLLESLLFVQRFLQRIETTQLLKSEKNRFAHGLKKPTDEELYQRASSLGG